VPFGMEVGRSVSSSCMLGHVRHRIPGPPDRDRAHPRCRRRTHPGRRGPHQGPAAKPRRGRPARAPRHRPHRARHRTAPGHRQDPAVLPPRTPQHLTNQPDRARRPASRALDAAPIGASLTAQAACQVEAGAQFGSRPARPMTRSSSGASSGRKIGGPNRPGVPCGFCSAEPRTNPWTTSSSRGSTAYG